MTNLSRYRPFFVMGSIYMIAMQIVVVALGLSGGLAGRADFRSFYSAGYLIRTGHGDQVYDYNKTAATESEVVGKVGANLPFIHPAYEGLLFALFSFFSYKKAFWLFFFLNMALLVSVFRLLMPAPIWMGETWAALPLMTVAGFLPVGICLIQGQDSILLLLIVAAACALQKAGRDFASGLVLGLGMFRFQMVIPLVVLLCFARKWKLLAGFAVTCFGVAAMSIATTAPASWMSYPQYLLAMSAGSQIESERLAHAIYPEAMPNLRGLFHFSLGERVSGAALQILTGVTSAALLGWAIVKRLPFELMVIVAVLVSYHGQIHDSVLLLLPLLECRIPVSPGAGKRLLAWSLLLACPVLAFVLRVPYAVLSLVYLAFIVAMPGSLYNKEQNAHIEDEAAASADGTPRGRAG